ncbi:unnamed protein product [Vitrella brassicaformis CCMP3155]|uniref:Uncharacterized protein n=1 Tax=Vitrella brassicaformis (strain CCMP3155) TaxID=1169540 RepID=A0A0G4G2B7_VITBC|nr:unnamed protein product [Vitrella brassicaformis CCMP3155]|eukprot:CEM21887.1 unnamed protein product [Vitrella brassicaformis CCMP3155]
MWGLLHTQRSPRLQGQEGDSVRDGHRRPSGVGEACYIQLPRVDEGDAAAQQAIHHIQTDHPKLPDVTDDITKAPRRFEQVPLVCAPAADDWEAPRDLTDSIRDAIWNPMAIKESDSEDLRKALDGLSPEQAEKVLTTREWCWGPDYGDITRSAVNFAARVCKDVEVFEVLLHNRRHLLKLKDEFGRTPLHLAAAKGSVDVAEKFVEWGGKELLEAQDNTGNTPLHHAAANEGHVDVVEWMLRVNPQLLKIKNDDGRTPLDYALHLDLEGTKTKIVGAMLAAAGELTMELLGEDEEGLSRVLQQPELLSKAVPYAKYGFGQYVRRCDSLGVDSLRWCSVFRQLMKSRPKDSLTDDFENTAS